MTDHLPECAGGFGCRCPADQIPAFSVAAWSPVMDRILVGVAAVVTLLTVLGVLTVHR